MTTLRFLTAAFVGSMVVAPLIAANVAGSTIPNEPLPVERQMAEFVDIVPGAFNFPVPGEFLVNGQPANAPVVKHEIPDAFGIMKHLVSQADYQRCVDAGDCLQADAVLASEPEKTPVTGVNYFDAQAYASWYSRLTDEKWRLPTDAEWAYAAGERFVGESYSTVANNPKNPAVAWIRRYKEEVAGRRAPDPVAHENGYFGPNSRGVFDLAGNIWEWTSTCYQRTTLYAATNDPVYKNENCRVHIAEGRHRAYMSDFIRDGVSGGCAVGTPPDNLGFRLIRENRLSIQKRILDYWLRAFGAQV